MEREIHCSACDALVPAGARHCPGCGMQLMAQAAPAVYVEDPRFSLWAVVVAAIGAFWILCYALDAIKK